jgi:hypothetical protein
MQESHDEKQEDGSNNETNPLQAETKPVNESYPQFSSDGIEMHQNGETLARRPSSRTYKKPYTRKEELSLEEQQEISRREEIILPLARERKRILERNSRGRVGRNKIQEAAQKIGCEVRYAHDLVDKYLQQMEKYPDEPERWGDCLGDNRGRPEETYTVLTKKHLLAIRLGLSVRTRTGIHADGQTKSEVELQPGIDITEDVYEFALGMCPDLPSIATVRREVARLIEKKPAYYKQLTEGEDALRRESSPKFPHDVSEVDEVWCWDACDLPSYIQHDGMVCTAVMLEIIDLYSDFRIHRIIIPKKEKDESDSILGVSFKKVDAEAFAATAMRRVNRRPLYFYNDRDARLNLEEKLPRITAPAETPTQMNRSLPGQPWGRGLKEVGFARRLHRVLRRYRGYYNKRNRMSIRKAIKNPNLLPTAADLEKELDALHDNLNKEPRVQEASTKKGSKRKAPSRADIYHSVVAPRPCPPIRRLFHLMPAERRVEDRIVFDHVGFDFQQGGEKHFVPTVNNRDKLPDLFLRWMNAANSKSENRFYAVKLDTGWVCEVCLEGQWFEAIPRSKFPFTVDDRMWARNAAIKMLREEIEADRKRDILEAITTFGALPERLNTTVRGEYRLPDIPDGQPSDDVDQTPGSGEENAASADGATSKNGNDEQGKPSKRKKQAQKSSEVPNDDEKRTKLDWSDLF